MMKTNRFHQAEREEGAILVAVLLAILALTVLGAATVYLAGASSEVTAAARAQDEALYVTEAGINYGVDYATQNPAQITAGYKTEGYGGSVGTDIQLQSGGSGVTVSGPSGVPVALTAAFALDKSIDSSGKNVKCGLVGYSDRFGQVRFKVSARGNGPGGATREIEAHVLSSPKDGMCPPGNKVVQYPGG